MRSNKAKRPQLGDEREVTRFLFVPTMLEAGESGMIQQRWLERACIRQRYMQYRDMPPGYAGWQDEAFVE